MNCVQTTPGRRTVACLCTLMLLAAPASYSQTLYRCGNNFSQVPCDGPDQTTFKARGSDPDATQSHSDRVSAMKAACEAWIRAVPAWKDRNSVTIGQITRGESKVVKMDEVSAIVIPYYTYVNAKNSYGGYTGEKIFTCHANEQETKIVRGISY